ncbi:Dabb family protein [Balneolaceae bacterium ANBcel3]|nr:Dabb family protein [Balneolaceae bacterium ANBcel3]
MILHSVYFYLKDDAPEDVPSRMEHDIKNLLSNISTVDEIWAGAPQGIDRDVVDNEYNTSLHVRFNSLEALQSYQTDPLHVSFVDTYKPYFKQIKVYDTRLA